MPSFKHTRNTKKANGISALAFFLAWVAEDPNWGGCLNDEEPMAEFP